MVRKKTILWCISTHKSPKSDLRVWIPTSLSAFSLLTTNQMTMTFYAYSMSAILTQTMHMWGRTHCHRHQLGYLPRKIKIKFKFFCAAGKMLLVRNMPGPSTQSLAKIIFLVFFSLPLIVQGSSFERVYIRSSLLLFIQFYSNCWIIAYTRPSHHGSNSFR